ncbi:MAG: tRNA pseudouridine(55) synthase TruB, partial [Deltaproteobacteria bacterium]
ILERRPVPVIEPGDLDEIFRRFSGTIEQVPPMYSALKKDGVPLYKLARRGQEVGRKPRKVHVRRLEVLHRDGDDICFEVTCSKGTYVRTLAHDIGRALGCGAHLTELRRTGAGPFRVEDAVRCEELAGLSSAGLRKRLLAPLEAMADYRRVPLTELEACRVANGQLPDTIARRLVRQPADGPVCLVTEDRLLAIAHRRGPARENWALQKVFPAS